MSQHRMVQLLRVVKAAELRVSSPLRIVLPLLGLHIGNLLRHERVLEVTVVLRWAHVFTEVLRYLLLNTCGSVGPMRLLRVLRRASHLMLHRDNLALALVSPNGRHLIVLDLLLQGYNLLQVLLLDYVSLRCVRAIVSLSQRTCWLLIRINIHLCINLFLLRT